jgi:hypothetical protein
MDSHTHTRDLILLERGKESESRDGDGEGVARESGMERREWQGRWKRGGVGNAKCEMRERLDMVTRGSALGDAGVAGKGRLDRGIILVIRFRCMHLTDFQDFSGVINNTVKWIQSGGR